MVLGGVVARTKQPLSKLVIDAPGPDGEKSVSVTTAKVKGREGGTQVAQNVNVGDTFVVTNDGKRLPADMALVLAADHTGGDATTLKRQWQVRFHSSCSHGLELGDKYGSVEVVGLADSAGCTATATTTTRITTTTTTTPSTTTSTSSTTTPATTAAAAAATTTDADTTATAEIDTEPPTSTMPPSPRPPLTLQPGPTDDLPGGRPPMPTFDPEGGGGGFTVKPANDEMAATKPPSPLPGGGVDRGSGSGLGSNAGSGSFWLGGNSLLRPPPHAGGGGGGGGDGTVHTGSNEKEPRFPSTTDLATSPNDGLESPSSASDEQGPSGSTQTTVFTALAAVFGLIVLVGLLLLAKWTFEAGDAAGNTTINPLQSQQKAGRAQNRLLPNLPPPSRRGSGKDYRSEILMADSGTFDLASSQEMLELLHSGSSSNNTLPAVEYDDVEAHTPAYLVPGMHVVGAGAGAEATNTPINAAYNDEQVCNLRLSTSHTTPADSIAIRVPQLEPTTTTTTTMMTTTAAATATPAKAAKGCGKYNCMRGGHHQSGGYAGMRDSRAVNLGSNQQQVGGSYAAMRTTSTAIVELEIYDEPVFNTPFGYSGNVASNGPKIKGRKEFLQSQSHPRQAVGEDDDDYHFPSDIPTPREGDAKDSIDSVDSRANRDKGGNRPGSSWPSYAEIAADDSTYATAASSASVSTIPLTSLAANAMQLKVKASEHSQYQVAPPSTYQARVSSANQHAYVSEPLRTPSYTAACSPPGSRRMSPLYESADLLLQDEARAGNVPRSVAADYALDEAGEKATLAKNTKLVHARPTAAAASDYHAIFAQKRMQMQVSAAQVEVQEEQGREHTYIPRNGMMPSNKLYDQLQSALTPATRPVGEVGDDYLDFC